MIIGIDVSVAQGTIEWDKVKHWISSSGESVGFAICKATQGNGYIDPQFRANWAGIASAGLIRGAYHFADPDPSLNDAEREATFFFDTVSSQGFESGVDFLALDIEQARKIHSGPEFVTWVLTFMRTLARLSKAEQVLYTGGPFFDTEAGNVDQHLQAELATYPLWLAAYVSSPDKYVPKPWAKVGWLIHQRSGDVAPAGETVLHVDGIGAGRVNVDKDVLFDGSVEELKQKISELKVPSDAPVVVVPVPAPIVPASVEVAVPETAIVPALPDATAVVTPSSPILLLLKFLLDILLKLFGKKS